MRLFIGFLLIGCEQKTPPQQDEPTMLDNDGDGYPSPEDCNDADALIYPGAEELCDNIDNDCNSLVDDQVETTLWFEDSDGDGYGNPDSTIEQCSQPTGYILDSQDCDDEQEAVNPDAIEVCNEIDDNCNGLNDEEDDGLFDALTTYEDFDGDGYGSEIILGEGCSIIFGGTDNQLDCDDTDSNVNPGATEICDAIDNDCDPTTTVAGAGIQTSEGTVINTSLSLGSPDNPVLFRPTQAQTIHLCQNDFSFQIESELPISIMGHDGASITLNDLPLYLQDYTESNIRLSGLDIILSGRILGCTECDVWVEDMTFQENQNRILELDGGLLTMTNTQFTGFETEEPIGHFTNTEVLMDNVEVIGNDCSFSSCFYFYGGTSDISNTQIFDNFSYTAIFNLSDDHSLSASNLAFVSPDQSLSDNGFYSIKTTLRRYRGGEGNDFTCLSGFCGQLSTDGIAESPDETFTTIDSDLRGNLYTVDESANLETLSIFVDNLTEECQVTFFYLIDDGMGNWDMEAVGTTDIDASHSGWVESPVLGRPLVAGQTVLFATGWNCGLDYFAQTLTPPQTSDVVTWTGDVAIQTNYVGHPPTSQNLLITTQPYAYTQRITVSKFVP
jgi:hypothetical protein